MAYINITLLDKLLFFFLILITCTIMRKDLTYKGIQIFMIINNLYLLSTSAFFWNNYVIKHKNEFLNITLNTNNWLYINYELTFKINSLNFLFMLLVLIIGLSTNIYILNYFKNEERQEDFILLINWFMFSMIFLVVSNNFFTIIIGWELIGLTSFLLINFWKFKTTTLTSSFKAFTFNKISDIFLMISFALLWNLYKINNVDLLLNIINLNWTNISSTVFLSCISLLLSASIKSAQIIGHLWLPDSMEAPVPASALIHSATLVSAGIYLILKFNVLFLLTNLYNVLFFIGSLTACYGGIVAAFQTDVKKLLAYSTISHCGFIVSSISLNNFLITIIYLYLHGIFKAMTFLCAGSIIKYNNTQDNRLMGININNLAIISFLIIASFNLGGLPFTLGYIYKSMHIFYLIQSNFSGISFGFQVIGLLCGLIYVYNIIYYTLYDIKKGYLNISSLLMQNNKNNNNIFFFNLNYTEIISLSLLYIQSLIFIIILKFYVIKNIFFVSHKSENSLLNYNYIFNLNLINSQYSQIYYILFFLIIIFIINFNNKTGNWFSFKIALIIKLIIISIICYIYMKLYIISLNLLFYIT